jgi:hypothetical protein
MPGNKPAGWQFTVLYTQHDAAKIESFQLLHRGNLMHIRKMVVIVGMALALPCVAQSAPGGAPAGGGAPAAGGAPTMVSLKVDGFFAQVDANKDGKLSTEEWKTAGLADNVFTMFDSKKTGFITKEVLASQKFPSEIDANSDGVLTVAEMIAFDKKPHGGPSGAAGGAPGGAQK